MARIEIHENLKRNHGFKAATPAQFGMTLAILLAAASFYLFIRGQEGWLNMLTGSVIFLLVSLLFPKILSPFNWVWIHLGLILAKITNPLILGFFYYLILTPVAFVYRTFSKESFHKKYKNKSGTWIPHSNQSNMKQQF